MSTTLAARLQLILTHAFVSALDLTNPVDNARIDLSANLADGSAAGQANQVWHDRRTLVAASELINLSGTGANAKPNAFGETAAFATVKGLVIRNRTTTSGANLIVGNASAAFVTPFNAATDRLKIYPGGLIVLWAPNTGYAVTGTTADDLKLDSGSATIEYDIYIIGTRV